MSGQLWRAVGSGFVFKLYQEICHPFTTGKVTLVRLQGTIDGAMTAFMMVNRNLEITYVNESTKKLLKEHENTLRSLYPGFSADSIPS